jgi:hypothetical protein
MNDELEMTWKIAVKTQSKYYSAIFQEELRKLRKISVRKVGVPAEIRIEHILNTR